MSRLASSHLATSKQWTTAHAEQDPVPVLRSLRPFKVDFPQADVDSLFSRLRDARYPSEKILHDDAQSLQTMPTPAWLKKVVNEFWLNDKEFSFKGMQDRLNRFDHYIGEIDWCKLHFVHKRSSRKDAIPIMLIHGWPGSFHEFMHIVDDLASPTNPKDPAFHVVVPSLPGFLFSSPPPSSAHLIGDIHGYSRILNALMVALGYGGQPAAAPAAQLIPSLKSTDGGASVFDGYAVQGGDWGSAHARVVAGLKGSKVKAVHLNFCPAKPAGWVTGPLYSVFSHAPLGVQRFVAGLVAGEEARQAVDKANAFESSMAYYYMQRWRPAQLSNGLIDSPLALLSYLGWFYQFRLPPLNRGNGTTLNVNSMLEIVTLFWLTSSIGTSFLPYTLNDLLFNIVMDPKERIKQPFGYSGFPEEIVLCPTSWIAATGDLRWNAKATIGGHFAALEVPQIFTEHLRTAFSKGGKRESREGGIKEMDVLKGGLWDAEFKKARQRL